MSLLFEYNFHGKRGVVIFYYPSVRTHARTHAARRARELVYRREFFGGAHNTCFNVVPREPWETRTATQLTFTDRSTAGVWFRGNRLYTTIDFNVFYIFMRFLAVKTTRKVVKKK